MRGSLPRAQTGSAREDCALIGSRSWSLIGKLRDGYTPRIFGNRRYGFCCVAQLDNKIMACDLRGGDECQICCRVWRCVEPEVAGPEIFHIKVDQLA